MKKTTLLLTLLIPVFTFSQIIHVPLEYSTIQEGIDAASSGDTVLVDTGTYFENINFIGKAITVASHYLIDVDSSNIYNTIINGSNPSHPDSASVVMFISGEDTTSVLCGFTITGGTGFLYPSIYQRGGGGIVGMQSGAKITNNIIANNSVTNETRAGGGGISFLGGSAPNWVSIRDNIIKSNAVSDVISAFGGGIYVSVNSIVERNNILNNSCDCTDGSAEGGGIEFQDFLANGIQLILTDNFIINNELEGRECLGGGVALLSGIGKNNCERILLNNPLPHETTSQINSNTIQSNNVNANTYWYGSGICLHRPTTNLNIESNIISNNTGSNNDYTYGGGLFLNLAEDRRVLINANNVTENNAKFGGGFYIQNSHNLHLSNNLFITNNANKGGAIHLFNFNGKGVRGNQQILTNNTFFDNYAEVGGALNIEYTPNVPQIYNSVFWENTTLSENGKDLSIATGSTVILSYNDLDVSSIQGSWTGDENIFENPEFKNSGDHPYQISDYSPCIDVGTPDTSGLNLPEYDLAGEVRIFNNRVDMGAYEWNTFVGEEEFEVEISIFEVDCYPNPFSVSTTFSYELLQPSTAHLSIFNHFGQRVDFIKQNQSQGKQQITWDASDHPSGVYYFRLQAGEQVASGKIVKLK